MVIQVIANWQINPLIFGDECLTIDGGVPYNVQLIRATNPTC
jgi:hypothetical protein